MPEGGNTYQQAVACSSAIEALLDRLRQSDALSGEQLQLVERAKAIYDRRALAAQAQFSGPGIADDLQQGELDRPSGGKALQAIGCIQQLAETG